MILEEIIRKQKQQIEGLEKVNIRLYSNCKTLAELLDKEKEKNKKAILELERYENDHEANRYAPIRETLDILKGVDKE